MKRFALLFSLLVVMAVSGVAHGDPLPVYVSILPQKYFVERLGGPLVDVSVMVMPGASPATYEPTARQMVGLSRAKAYFSIGAPFENAWLSRIADANQDMVLFRTDSGIEKRPMDSGHHGHNGHNHGKGTPDPHIWLSPKLVETVAANTCAGLIEIDPANAARYQANLEGFLSDINELDEAIRVELAGVPESRRSFMVFHPSWGYFAHQYGLRQIPIEVEGKSPSPRELAEIVEHGKELGIGVVFVQPQFSSRSARVIATEIGATVAPLDPLAENWTVNLRKAAALFQQQLR